MYDDDDFDFEVTRLASERNPGMAFFPGEDSGNDRDYPDPRDY